MQPSHPEVGFARLLGLLLQYLPDSSDYAIRIEPNSPSEGVVVAFIVDNGAPIELLQFRRTGTKHERDM